MSQTRGDDGKFIEKTTVEEVLAVLKAANEPQTATEIADQLGISNRTALDKLNELNERDPTVIRKQVGASAVIWFIRHGAIHEQAFEAFADRLTASCGDVIDRIILYGSVARGEAHEDSDVDVLIVVEDESEREGSDREDESERERVHEHASELSFAVMMEYDVLISEMIVTREEYEKKSDGSFFTTVRQEGRTYAR